MESRERVCLMRDGSGYLILADDDEDRDELRAYCLPVNKVWEPEEESDEQTNRRTLE